MTTWDYKIINHKNIILYSITIILLAVFSYYYIDQPVAEWGYYNTRDYSLHFIYQYITYLAPIFYDSSPWVILLILLDVKRNNFKLKYWHKIFLLMFISMVLTFIFTEQLKFIFGRYWPATFYHGNLSWISNKAYGFTWFKPTREFHSFPSGHTAVTCGFMLVLFFISTNKNLKILSIISCLSVGIGLILMCYHFVSDVLIGSLVGTLWAYLTSLYFIRLTKE